MPVETHKTPMFLKFLNKEIGVSDLLFSFSSSDDSKTSTLAKEALKNPPNLEDFHQELTGAVNDLIEKGLSEELKNFANHYLSALVEDASVVDGPLGRNTSHVGRVKDIEGPWIQAFICYNLCLYIKVYGLSDLKKCRVCGKVFCNKGKYAVYCSDQCKSKKGG